MKDYIPKVTALVKVYDSSKKDFPQKDYGKKGRKGWNWMISICPNGHIVELRKSHCSEGVWGSLKCSKFCQKGT
jgi:hypothetical protein